MSNFAALNPGATRRSWAGSAVSLPAHSSNSLVKVPAKNPRCWLPCASIAGLSVSRDEPYSRSRHFDAR
ncbi:MAG: hypothetical protein QOJ15_1170 [Bradyrhizobium sp.]|nr:hypothetical protein [Bradyrhizobium sp.]